MVEYTAKEGAEGFVKELKKLGYTCTIKEKAEDVEVFCKPETFDILRKDKIHTIEVLLPKKEPLFNLLITTENDLKREKIEEWLKPRIFGIRVGPHIAERKEYEIEVGARNAYSVVKPLASSIIENIRNKRWVKRDENVWEKA